MVNTELTSPEDQLRQQFQGQLTRRLRYRHLLLGGGAVIGLAVAVPVIIAAVEAGVGLLALAGLAAMAFAGWRMVPRFVLTIENREREKIQQEMNRHLAALKAEAKKNPIEQAENEYLRRTEQYQAFKTAMEQIGGKIRAFKSKLDQTKRDKPGYDLRTETEALTRMQDFYTNRMQRLETAAKMLTQFKDKIEEARIKWDFQLQANDAIRAMNATDRDAQINVILTEVAFDQVQSQFDEVFAKLDVDAAEMRGKNALDFGGASIDLDTLQHAQAIAP